MIRKNKGDFFYYLDVSEGGEIAVFTKKKRAYRHNPDGTISKTKRQIYSINVDLTEDGLALFHANKGNFDFNILKEMLEGSLK